MARFDPDAEHRWRVDSRLTDLESRVGRVEAVVFTCPFCGAEHTSRAARDFCDCDD